MATAKFKSRRTQAVGKLSASGTNPSASREFLRAMAQHPDESEAVEMVAQQAGYEWTAQHGAELEICRHKLAGIEERNEASKKEHRDLVIQRANTNRHVSSAKAHGAQNVDESEQVPWNAWQMKDRILIVLCGIGCLAALGLGAANVLANLLASGTPLFIDQPWLAVSLSMLLPIASVAIKFGANLSAYDSWRRGYALVIYILLLIVILVWSFLFAQNFPGVAQLDLDSMLEGGRMGPALVWSQLIVEMLGGAALFLAAEDIYVRYSPEYVVESFKYRQTCKALKEREPEHQRLDEEHAHILARITVLEAELRAHINERKGALMGLRRRINAANDFTA